MRFNVFNSKQVISITFAYDICPQPTKLGTEYVSLLRMDRLHQVVARVTRCTIRDVQPNQLPEDGMLLASCETAQQPDSKGNLQSDCKYTARRIAMRKALRACDFTKEQRTHIWEDYMKKVHVPKSDKYVKVTAIPATPAPEGQTNGKKTDNKSIGAGCSVPRT